MNPCHAIERPADSPRRTEGACTILRRPFGFDGCDVVDRDGEHVAAAVNPGMARLLAEAYNAAAGATS